MSVYPYVRLKLEISGNNVHYSSGNISNGPAAVLSHILEGLPLGTLEGLMLSCSVIIKIELDSKSKKADNVNINIM